MAHHCGYQSWLPGGRPYPGSKLLIVAWWSRDKLPIYTVQTCYEMVSFPSEVYSIIKQMEPQINKCVQSAYGVNTHKHF